MIKNLTAIVLLMACLTACSGNSAKAEPATARTTTTTTQTTTVSDTTLMITNDIPEGSVKVQVNTTAGSFVILLYGDTPGHRDNFIKHVENGDYDGVLFHRVIKDFMVQGGDPNSKDAAPGQMLGSGDMGAPIPAEIVFPRHFHKRGALAAARQGDQTNPERKSSASQFYVVTGKVYSDAELDMMERRLRQSVGQNHFNQLVQEHRDEIARMQADGDRDGLTALQHKLSDETNAWLESHPVAMTPEMRKAYTTVGGTPHLDNEYTVYGEVISGMSTIDKIQRAATGAMDRPVDDIKVISMKVID